MATSSRSRPANDASAGDLLRFDVFERGVHWSNAVLFVVLVATGAVFWFPELTVIVNRREVVRTAHEYAGFAFGVVLLAALWGPWSRGLRRDAARIDVFDADDRRWLRGGWRTDLFGNRGADDDVDDVVPQGKFNAGQKLNSVFSTAAMVVLAGTGLVMFFNRSFPQTIVQGANLVHGATAVVLTVVVAGHVALALRDRNAMRSMVTGRAEQRWARRHHRKWVDAETGG